MNVVRTLSRPMLASVFLVGAYNQFSDPDALAAKAGSFIASLPGSPPVSGRAAVQTNATVMAVAGTGLALGLAPRLSALALAGALVPTTVVGHPFWKQTDPTVRARQRTSFFGNVAMLGGLLSEIATRH